MLENVTKLNKIDTASAVSCGDREGDSVFTNNKMYEREGEFPAQ